MQLLGHMALGYFAGNIASRYTKEKINIPLLWIFSLLPDLDILFERYLVHRGPTHSIIVATAIFIPLYLLTKRGIPYYASLATHTLIGDYFNPSEMLFWPISNDWYGAPTYLSLMGTTLILVEVSLFALMIIVIIVERWRHRRSRLSTEKNAET